VAYSLVTVRGGAPVTNTNSAFALADCKGCTTVAVSFQVILIIGRSKLIAPINAAGALNYNCPACSTTAIAEQLVVTLKAQPSQALLAQLSADLKRLNAVPALGAGGTPAAVAAEVASVQSEIDSQLNSSGLRANPPPSSTTSAAAASPTTTTSSASGSSAQGSTTASGQTGSSSSSAGSSSPASPAASSPATTQTTATTAATSTTATTSSTTATTSSSG
jgi:putative peptide zinc metalloprotease protein